MWSGLQVALMQSLPTMHALPFAQDGHVPPPQSMSVSAAFLALSVHVGAAPPVPPPDELLVLLVVLPVVLVEPVPVVHPGRGSSIPAT
jgi:hypothetical protein